MIKTIAVIGSGTMGNGIAHVFALQGFSVRLTDQSGEALQKAMSTISKNMDRQVKKEQITEADKKAALGRITTFTSLQEAVAEAALVIEAATEQEQIKLNIFRELSQYASPEAILATNTSSISITKLAAATARPERVIGMHFMNPVPVMQLVEVIKGYATAPEVVAQVIDFSQQLGKIPLLVNDYPGFIANRILMPMLNEAMIALYEGVSGVQEIDQIMQLGMAHPMGPLRLADFIGLDVCLSILQVLHQGFGNPKYAPCPLLVNMVAAGKLGVKSGEGFYDYRKDTKQPAVAVRFA